ncbi:quinolinate synthase NadA [Dehalobacter sp. DCM]|uniref:quinolinate synthase NadA n=1 Tax=Dehalobacter sp. DCM TaxID=2907827 RepID=UPI0030821F69|nr:quinolinate synthase NadA [Dehalobacter sp. DCM]
MNNEYTNNQLINEINALRKEKNAVILAHYYQPGEIQDIADFVGDSLQLAQQAAATDADVIVFCGVHFMAESAAILSPDKVVVLPDPQAGCPMADMVEPNRLREEKAKHPGIKVVCYVNSSAEVKAESDICCTSSNAEKVVDSLGNDDILFIPDGNLGRYIAAKTKRAIQFWPGFCPTHHRLAQTDILNKRKEFPKAKVLVHPECREEVWQEADYVGSTAGIIQYAVNSPDQEFIIGTECGILHELSKRCPRKKFHMASEYMICPNMKKVNLEKVRYSLRNLEPIVSVSDEIRKKSISALEKMLAVK